MILLSFSIESLEKIVWYDTFICLSPVVVVPGHDPAEMIHVGRSCLHQYVAVGPARPVSLFIRLSVSD